MESARPARFPSRFAIVHARDADAAARWAAAHEPERVVAVGCLRIASWGPWRQSQDGRAEGTLDGAIFSDLALVERWLGRGLALNSSDHPRLAIEEVGAYGPRGLESMRWQGSVCVAHRGQQAVLVARDVMGVGGLYLYSDREDLWLMTSDPSLAPQAQQVPPGVALRIEGGQIAPRLTAHALRPLPEHQPWYRDIPDGLARATASQVRAGAATRLRAAVAACRRAFGGLQVQPDDVGALAWMADEVADLLDDRGAIWAVHGAASLVGADLRAYPEPSRRRGPWPEPSPAEPVARACDQDRAARSWRATDLADGWLQQARAQALRQGRPVVAPHLDPALLAWLGAVPIALRRQALASGPPSA